LAVNKISPQNGQENTQIFISVQKHTGT